MDAGTIRAERLRSHRLSAPAASLADAAAHMTATQSQEFWAGRWALAARTRGAPTLSDVDAAFERGELVRSWTMRGTLHIVAPRDLGWILSVTAQRQAAQLAGILRAHGSEESDVDRAERAIGPALAGGNRLTRAEVSAVLEGAGIDAGGSRGNHLLWALAVRQVVVFGPVIPREGAPTRDQYVVAVEGWITDAASPADPLAELFVRYVAAHGPACVADFRWWAGVPLGLARTALEGARDRLTEVDDGVFMVAGPRPRRAASAPTVHALAPFDEYYLSYADRTVAAPPDAVPFIGPSANGYVRPVLIDRGEVVGTWSHSVAVGKHHLDPVPHLFADLEAPASVAAAPPASVTDALARVRRFLSG